MAIPRILSCIALVTLVFYANGSAHSPVEFLEALAVNPARTVKHAVQLKSEFDAEKVNTELEGPVLFSHSIGCMGRPAKKHAAYLNWFKIVNPSDNAVRQFDVLDMVRGAAQKTLKVQGEAYLLSPSQRITSGPPDPVPGGLDLYKAYRIINASPINREVSLTGTLGPEKRQLGKPLFVCMPVDQWHHDEHVSASHPRDCFVIYEMDALPIKKTYSTIDQFGLNELQSSQSRWLCVRGGLLRAQED